jgi:DNA-binding MarR family transcriptional regulator
VLVCLTDKGRKVVGEIKPLLADANREFLAGLTPRDQKQLRGLLQKLRDSRQGGAALTE